MAWLNALPLETKVAVLVVMIVLIVIVLTVGKDKN